MARLHKEVEVTHKGARHSIKFSYVALLDIGIVSSFLLLLLLLLLDENLSQLRHFDDDLLTDDLFLKLVLGSIFHEHPRVLPDLLQSRPMMVVVSHHLEDKILKLIRDKILFIFIAFRSCFIKLVPIQNCLNRLIQ